jgi:hypothetical protein
MAVGIPSKWLCLIECVFHPLLLLRDRVICSSVHLHLTWRKLLQQSWWWWWWLKMRKSRKKEKNENDLRFSQRSLWSILSSGTQRRISFLSTSSYFLAWLILRPWRWRRQFPAKVHLTLNGLTDIIAKNLSIQKRNSAPLVRKRTMPTERPPLVVKVSANFFG